MEIYKRTILSLIAILLANTTFAITLYDLLKTIEPHNKEVAMLLNDKSINTKSKDFFKITPKRDTVIVDACDYRDIVIWSSTDSVFLWKKDSGTGYYNVTSGKIDKQELLTVPEDFDFLYSWKKDLLLKWDLDSILILNNFPIDYCIDDFGGRIKNEHNVYRFVIINGKFKVQKFVYKYFIGFPDNLRSEESLKKINEYRRQSYESNPSYWEPIYNRTSDLIEKSEFDPKPQRRKFKY